MRRYQQERREETVESRSRIFCATTVSMGGGSTDGSPQGPAQSRRQPNGFLPSFDLWESEGHRGQVAPRNLMTRHADRAKSGRSATTRKQQAGASRPRRTENSTSAARQPSRNQSEEVIDHPARVFLSHASLRLGNRCLTPKRTVSSFDDLPRVWSSASSWLHGGRAESRIKMSLLEWNRRVRERHFLRRGSPCAYGSGLVLTHMRNWLYCMRTAGTRFAASSARSRRICWDPEGRLSTLPKPALGFVQLAGCPSEGVLGAGRSSRRSGLGAPRAVREHGPSSLN